MTMSDIARLAGVSIATVSRVINQPQKVSMETRQRVEEILERTSFVANGMARGLVKNSMKTIGVLAVDVRDLYFANVIYTIERQFTELGYNVILSNTGGELGDKKKYLQVMLEKQVDGLILVGSVFKERTDNKHIFAASQKVPVVMVNSLLEGENIYSVVCDDLQGVKNAVDYLFQAGHREIYYLNDIKTYSGLAKIEGFIQGMRAHGLSEENILEVDRSIEGGFNGVRRLLAEGRRVTALLTGEDITAVGALKALRVSGLCVPDEVAVIGYNNSILAEVSTPSLSSIDNLSEAMGRNAVQILYHALQGKQTFQRLMLVPNLVLRESTTEKALS